MGPAVDYSFSIIERILMYRKYKSMEDVLDISLAVMAVIGGDKRFSDEIKASYREAHNKIKKLSFSEVQEIVAILTSNEEDESEEIPQTPQDNYRKGVELYKKKSYYEAVPLFQNAAKGNHPAAIYNLAVCYYYGRGVTEDKIKARELWNEASKAGIEAAGVALKTCYETE